MSTTTLNYALVTGKAKFRTLIIEAMNNLRTRGVDPEWQSVCKYIENSGKLMPGDWRENPSGDRYTTFQYTWQTTLSFVASEMKKNGELVREHYSPWLLTSWGITSIQLSEEIRKRRKLDFTCVKCFCEHRPELECY